MIVSFRGFDFTGKDIGFFAKLQIWRDIREGCETDFVAGGCILLIKNAENGKICWRIG